MKRITIRLRGACSGGFRLLCSHCQTKDSTSNQIYITLVELVHLHNVMEVVITLKSRFGWFVNLILILPPTSLFVLSFVLPYVSEVVLGLGVSPASDCHTTAQDLDPIRPSTFLRFSVFLLVASPKWLFFFIVPPIAASLSETDSSEIVLNAGHLDIAQTVFDAIRHAAVELAIDLKRQSENRFAFDHALIVTEGAVDDEGHHGLSEDDEDAEKAERYIFHGDEAGKAAEASALFGGLANLLPDEDEHSRKHAVSQVAHFAAQAQQKEGVTDDD
jgi:hypothetical protein